MSEPRYKVIPGSDSAHCCFEATVVDTHKTDITGRPYTWVCECFYLSLANAIADAMNAADPLRQLMADADRASEEEEPITVTPDVKQAVVDAMLKYGPTSPHLYRIAQDTAPDDVDVDEHEFAEFMEECHGALRRLI